MGHPRYSTQEIARKGKEIYDRHLKEILETANVGKLLVIEVETGDYELDDHDCVYRSQQSVCSSFCSISLVADQSAPVME
jgi:hypothetical protein